MSDATDKANEYFGTAWDKTKLAFAGGMGIVKKGWTIAVLIAALAGAAGYIYYLDYKQKQAQKELEVVQEQAQKLADKANELIQLNQENQKVYEQLAKDRAQVEALVQSVNYQMQANAKALSQIGRQVSKLDDGPVAPVLKETVRLLQEMRFKNENK